MDILDSILNTLVKGGQGRQHINLTCAIQTTRMEIPIDGALAIDSQMDNFRFYHGYGLSS